MARLFTDEAKLATWLKVEIQILKSRAACGHLDTKIAQRIEKKLQESPLSWERVLELEEKLKHDVLSFLTVVNEVIGEDSRHVHFGMTSSDVVDTAFAYRLSKSCELLLTELSKNFWVDFEPMKDNLKIMKISGTLRLEPRAKRL